jgi:hypothetical protein
MKFFPLPLFIILSTGVLSQNNVGIGTASPAYRLHVVDAVNDARAVVQAPVGGEFAEIQLMAGTNVFNYLSLRKYHQGIPGTLAGIPKNNLSALVTGGNSGSMLLSTSDDISPIIFASGTGEHMRITGAGRVGIGVSNPTAPVDIQNATSGNDFLMKVRNSGNGNGFISIIDNPGVVLLTNKAAIIGQSVNNTAVAGLAEGDGFGIYGFSENNSGILGGSVNGIGVYGITSSPFASAGYFSHSHFGGTALEINGAFKVSGDNKPVFQITAVTGPGGNTSGNTLTIPNTTQAKNATDLLIVTPVYVSVYLNKPIGVWWDGNKWNIFIQDQSNMPNGAVFNVMVVKQ